LYVAQELISVTVEQTLKRLTFKIRI